MKKFILSFAVAFAALFFCGGCAEPVLFAEVFQLGENDKLYTAYNIWYTSPDDISCLNIQQGAFIPVGTEIQPVEAYSGCEDKIVFRDMAGKIYTIKFNDGYRLCSMRDYISYTFTRKNREEQLKGVSARVRKHILRGEVVKGMSEHEVKLCYGPPPAVRTPDLRNETWFYWLTPSETVRLVFRAGKVRNILNYNQR